jgi:hypothetical protein
MAVVSPRAPVAKQQDYYYNMPHAMAHRVPCSQNIADVPTKQDFPEHRTNWPRVCEVVCWSGVVWCCRVGKWQKALSRPVGNSAAESGDPQSPVRGLYMAYPRGPFGSPLQLNCQGGGGQGLVAAGAALPSSTYLNFAFCLAL